MADLYLCTVTFRGPSGFSGGYNSLLVADSPAEAKNEAENRALRDLPGNLAIDLIHLVPINHDVIREAADRVLGLR